MEYYAKQEITKQITETNNKIKDLGGPVQAVRVLKVAGFLRQARYAGTPEVSFKASLEQAQELLAQADLKNIEALELFVGLMKATTHGLV